MTFQILLVEDDRAIRTVLGDALQHDGHQVTTAADGDEALAAAFDTHIAAYRAEARTAHKADLERIGMDDQDEPSSDTAESK